MPVYPGQNGAALANLRGVQAIVDVDAWMDVATDADRFRESSQRAFELALRRDGLVVEQVNSRELWCTVAAAQRGGTIFLRWNLSLYDNEMPLHRLLWSAGSIGMVGREAFTPQETARTCADLFVAEWVKQNPGGASTPRTDHPNISLGGTPLRICQDTASAAEALRRRGFVLSPPVEVAFGAEKRVFPGGTSGRDLLGVVGHVGTIVEKDGALVVITNNLVPPFEAAAAGGAKEALVSVLQVIASADPDQGVNHGQQCRLDRRGEPRTGALQMLLFSCGRRTFTFQWLGGTAGALLARETVMADDYDRVHGCGGGVDADFQ
ncbi:MAG: hypothetical protein ACYC6F_18405 [Longimicrobiales bacterium]